MQNKTEKHDMRIQRAITFESPVVTAVLVLNTLDATGCSPRTNEATSLSIRNIYI